CMPCVRTSPFFQTCIRSGYASTLGFPKGFRKCASSGRGQA
ncbi:MAG: hypothetical protein AVDCRST_MAG78-1197, partial [uncultured Rubrobacteraceae bacterium]